MIHVCARGARADEAFEWLECMEEAGIAPNAVTLSALINACGRAGQLTGPRGAFRVLADMQRAGLTPNVITYTTLLDACAKACELRWAVAVFREMLAKGVQPNDVTCHALFCGCLQQGAPHIRRTRTARLAYGHCTRTAHALHMHCTCTAHAHAHALHTHMHMHVHVHMQASCCSRARCCATWRRWACAPPPTRSPRSSR